METESLNLSVLAPAQGSRHRKKRLGFGESSGLGKTCGKGHKGHRARSGYRLNPGFEGGQMPLHRRLPKVGFTSRKRTLGVNVFEVVSLTALVAAAERLEAGAKMTKQAFADLGLVSSPNALIKVLGGGAVDKKLVVEADAFSASAKEAIEKAGGSAVSVAKPSAKTGVKKTKRVAK